MISDFKTKVTTQSYTFLGISISLNFRKIYCNFLREIFGVTHSFIITMCNRIKNSCIQISISLNLCHTELTIAKYTQIINTINNNQMLIIITNSGKCSICCVDYTT